MYKSNLNSLEVSSEVKWRRERSKVSIFSLSQKGTKTDIERIFSDWFPSTAKWGQGSMAIRGLTCTCRDDFSPALRTKEFCRRLEEPPEGSPIETSKGRVTGRVRVWLVWVRGKHIYINLSFLVLNNRTSHSIKRPQREVFWRSTYPRQELFNK